MFFPRHTIDHSQDETSEMLIGEWAEKRQIRDQLFIATKVSRVPTPKEGLSRYLL